jgi:hypothetical protein
LSSIRIIPASVADAAQADIVLIALRWVDLESVLRPLPAWNGRKTNSRQRVVAFHEAALAAGGKDNGETAPVTPQLMFCSNARTPGVQ